MGSGPNPGALPNRPSPVRNASHGKKPSSMSPTSAKSRPVASFTAASMRGLKPLGSTNQTIASTPSSVRTTSPATTKEIHLSKRTRPTL